MKVITPGKVDDWEGAIRKLKTGSYAETWKQIAAWLGRSERWCRYMAKRAVNPLPVFKVGGIVRLNAKDASRWLEREERDSIAEEALDAIAAKRIGGVGTRGSGGGDSA